jgi:hypothetical protein
LLVSLPSDCAAKLWSQKISIQSGSKKNKVTQSVLRVQLLSQPALEAAMVNLSTQRNQHRHRHGRKQNPPASLHLHIGFAFVLRLQHSGPVPPDRARFDSFLDLPALGVFDPTAVNLTHRLVLSQEQFVTLLPRVPSKPQLADPPSPIFWTQPGPTAGPNANARGSTTAARSSILRGTPADGIALAASWDPEKLGLLSEFDEPLLLSKLCLCQPDSPSSMPGYNLLSTLAKVPAQFEAHLLLALECGLLGAPEESASSLGKYVTEVRQRGVAAHPLLLLALARRNKDSSLELKYLRELHTQHPSVVRLLTNAEKAKLGLEGFQTPGDGLGKQPDLQARWEQMKLEGAPACAAMDQLLALVGLRKVKERALEIYKQALILRPLSADSRKKRLGTFNFSFVGNPGTGKTTVGKLLSEILAASGLRGQQYEECSAQKLLDQGIDEFNDRVKRAMGGVLFIDEAYMLEPGGNPTGKKICNRLLELAEANRLELSIILCGYQDDIEKLMNFNSGFKSRFEQIPFEDYDPEDLEKLWVGMLTEKDCTCSVQVTKLLGRLLAGQRGQRGFGNARAVRFEVERAIARALPTAPDPTQMVRISSLSHIIVVAYKHPIKGD